MSLVRVVAQSGLSSRVCKIMARCLGVKNKEPKHVPRRLRTRTIRVETSGSGSFIMSVHAKNDMTVANLRQIVADFKNMHITMIGFTDGHGGSIIYDDSRQLRLFPKNMIFVSYVKSAKCMLTSADTCTGNCDLYIGYGIPVCMNCCDYSLQRASYMRYTPDEAIHSQFWTDRCKNLRNLYRAADVYKHECLLYFGSYLNDKCNSEDVHQNIEQLLFGTSYTSSRRCKTSKSQQTTWYNNNKHVNNVRVQKRTKKSHR